MNGKSEVSNFQSVNNLSKKTLAKDELGLLLQSDKVRSAVAMNESDYDDKLNELLSIKE